MRVIAHGPLKTLSLTLGILVVVIVGGTYLTPFTAEYEVKTAAKVACNEYRYAVRGGTPNDRAWEKKFVARAVVAGVHLREDQYDFQLANDLDTHDPTCHIKAKWLSSTEAFLIGGIVTELPKMTILHDIDYVYKIKAKY